MDEAWRTSRPSEPRSEADAAKLVMQQTDQMITMARAMGLESLLPTLEHVRDEAARVLARCRVRLAN